MEFKDAFDLTLKQAEVANGYWQFYSTVSLAILGGIVGSDTVKSSKIGVLALLGGFWVFSLGNLAAIAHAHAVTVSLAAVTDQLALSTPGLAKIHTKLPSLGEVCGFHVLCDLGLTTAVLAVAFRFWKSHSDALPSEA